jgi:hypothetical protein
MLRFVAAAALLYCEERGSLPLLHAQASQNASSWSLRFFQISKAHPKIRYLFSSDNTENSCKQRTQALIMRP